MQAFVLLDEDIYRSLDEARKWVVLGFTDFTSPKMHELSGERYELFCTGKHAA